MPTKLTTKDIIKRCKDVHGDTYDYSLVEYSGGYNKIKIICKTHGVFEQNPTNHYHLKHGCPKCKNCFKLDKDYFIEKSKAIHGDFYDYSKVAIGKNNKQKVIIICKKHGEFLQRPNDHISGYGCIKCGNNIISKEEFITLSNGKHKNKYDYSLVEYNNIIDKIKIICPIHGVFIQQAFCHLRRGNGCKVCSEQSVSKVETEWLDKLQIPNENRQYPVLDGKYIVDGYAPKTNTVYEFYGDYWHGNPNVFSEGKYNVMAGKTYKELYEKTLQREAEIISAGYKVVSIWENDYNHSSS